MGKVNAHRDFSTTVTRKISLQAKVTATLTGTKKNDDSVVLKDVLRHVLYFLVRNI